MLSKDVAVPLSVAKRGGLKTTTSIPILMGASSIRVQRNADPAVVCDHKGPCRRPRASDERGRQVDDLSRPVTFSIAWSRARFSELEVRFPTIFQRMLTLMLRNLELDGLVTREVFPEIPPRVERELTSWGRVCSVPHRASSTGYRHDGRRFETRSFALAQSNLLARRGSGSHWSAF
jgi:hypothetical protein